MGLTKAQQEREMAEVVGGRIETLEIDEIVPYWRNPRTADEHAVQAVADSITRYGYQVPIIVDAHNVIIAGHTRYLALRKLGWTRVRVLVSDLDEKRAKEFRIIDNRVAENTNWNKEALLLELREFTERAVLELHFPEFDPDSLFVGKDGTPVDITETDIEKANESIEDALGPTGSVGGHGGSTTTITCPHCYEEFNISV